MVDGVRLFFGIGMVAGMCLTIAFLAAAIVLLTLHNRIANKKEDDDEETRFISD